MARRVSSLRIAVALLLLPVLTLASFQGCATLPSVDGNTCGDGLRAEEEQCDLPDGGNAETGYCGKAGTEHACLWVVTPGKEPSCRPERIKDGERCLVASGIFGAEESLPGLYPVASGDFDADGQFDLVHDGVSGRTVTFFDNGLAVNPGVVIGSASFNDWPAVDVDRDGRTDLLVPTTARDGIGVLAGQANRGFAARFQSSVSVPEASHLLIALPPASRSTNSGQEYFDPADRSLRQLGVLYTNPTPPGGTSLCVVGLDKKCTPVPIGNANTFPDLAPEAVAASITIDPFFITTPTGINAYVTALAARTSAKAIRVLTTPAGSDADVINIFPEVFATATAQESCNFICGVAPCDCSPITAPKIHALKVVPFDLGDGKEPVLAAAASFTVNGQEYLGSYIASLASGAYFLPLDSVDTALALCGPISRLELGDLDGNPGSTEFIVSQLCPGENPDMSSIKTEIFFTETGYETRVTGPDGNLTVGDINGDGFDDVIGADSQSPAGGTIFFGGLDLPLTKAPLPIEGYNPDLYVADLDGNGIKDIVVTTTPEPKAGLERTLVVHFGRPYDLPEAPVSLGQAENRQVLPLSLQVKSTVDVAGEAAVSDGIEDLAVLQSADSASFVTGDINGYPLSPYFFGKDLRKKLALDAKDIPILFSTIALPNPAATSVEGEAPPANEDAPIALLTFLVFSEAVDEQRTFMMPLFSRNGRLSLEPENTDNSIEPLDLNGLIPLSDAVFYDGARTKFGVIAATDFDSGERTVLLLSLSGSALKLDKSVATRSLESDGFMMEPKLLTGSLPPITEDSTIWLVEMTTEGTMDTEGTVSLISLTGEPRTFPIAARYTSVQWLGPHSAQIGATVVDFQGTLAAKDGSLVEDTCLEAGDSFYDPLLHTSAYYLSGNALPDRVRALPFGVAPQLEGTTCEARAQNDGD